MGMFDYYEPDPPLRCPDCDHPLSDWQGKDGSCVLRSYRAGDIVEICKDWRDWGYADSEREWAEDESRFAIYTPCDACGRWVDARCTTDEEGHWVSTAIVELKSS